MADDRSGRSSWQVVTNPSVTSLTIPSEALEAAPIPIDVDMDVPRSRRAEGRCALCGEFGPLTREHLPPQAAGNTGAGVEFQLENWLGRDADGEWTRGKPFQAGFWQPTLCRECNGRTGDLYAKEYRAWAASTANLLGGLPDIDDLQQESRLRALDFKLSESLPGAFVRQVLSMLVSAASPAPLTHSMPSLRSIVLDSRALPVEAPLRIGMALFMGPRALVYGPLLVVETAAPNRWKWVAGVAFPPFSFELEIATSVDPPATVSSDISQLTSLSPTESTGVRLDLAITFGNSGVPDWRSQRMIDERIELPS